MAFSVKDWRNATASTGGGDTSTPLDAAALEDLETRLSGYTDTEIAAIPPGGGGMAGYYDVTDYGAAGDNTADDTDEIQDAIDAASAATYGGVVYFPPGRYKCSSGQLTVPLNKAVNLVGAGSDVSLLNFPSDLGSGEWAIEVSNPTTSVGYRHHFTGIGIDGPGGGSLGVSPCDMDGIRMGGNYHMRNCRVEGFHAGIGICGDHIEVLESESSNNYYNIYFLKETDFTNLGNAIINGCDIAGPHYASIAVSQDSIMDATTMVGTHMGFGPFCIYGEPGLTAALMSQSYFAECSFESYGNAIIYTTTGNADIIDCTFDTCNEFNSFAAPGYQIATAGLHDYAVKCQNISARIVGGWGAFTQAGTVAIFSANPQNSFYWDGSAHTIEGTSDKIFDGAVASAGARIRFASTNCRPMILQGTVAVGDLLQAGSAEYRAVKYTTGLEVGVAMQAGISGDTIPVAYKGQTAVKQTTAVSVHQRLKPDTVNNGCVTPASSFSDGPIVGFANGASSGGFVQTILNLPGPE